MTLTSKTFNQRLAASLQFASSTYSAPSQQEIDEFGFQNSFLNSETNQAFQGSVSISLVKDDSPYATTLTVKGGQYDPQYRVISGFSGADQRFWDVALNGKLNRFLYSLSGGSSRDNLDDVPFMLTTQTDNINISLSIPLQELFIGSTRGRTGYQWIPSFNYTYSYLGQFGVSNPLQDPESFFNNLNQIPAQYNNISKLDLGWNFGKVKVSFGYGYTFQNNEQRGREQEDNYIGAWNLGLSWSPSQATTITPRISYVSEKSQLTDLEQRNLQHGLDLTTQISNRLGLSLGYAYGSLTTSSGFSSNTNLTVYGQASYSFLSPLGLAYQSPGSLFLRLNYTTLSQEDILAGISSSGGNFWINAGFSVKLF